MRRGTWLLLTFVLAGIALWPDSAVAKGSGFRFVRDHYSPGERAVAHARVGTWPGSGQPDDAPYPVYLVRGGQPLWFGHLPRTAVRVGKLHIGRRLEKDEYRVSVAFEVPPIPEGTYSVWVCRGAKGVGGTGCWVGFGDLTYGRIRIRERPEFLGTPLVSRASVYTGRDSPAAVLWTIVFVVAVFALSLTVHGQTRRPTRARLQQ